MTENYSDTLQRVERAVFDAISETETHPPLVRMTESTPKLIETLLSLIGEVGTSRRMLIHDLRREGHTLQQVGKMVGLSTQRISQLEKSSNG